jgi:hypothetical protein
LDGKYKTTSFFGVKLLKCPFEKKINLKNAPKNNVVLKRKKKKKNRKKKKKEEEDARTQANRAVNELSLGEPGLSKLAYLKILRARARAELFAELKI